MNKLKYILFDYKIVLVAFAFIVLDIFTGLVSAWATGTFRSSAMREGGKHKIVLIMTVIFGIALDYAQQLCDIGISVPATAAICGYISLMEIMSCVENINKGFPDALPRSLVSILRNVAEEHEVKGDDAE